MKITVPLMALTLAVVLGIFLVRAWHSCHEDGGNFNQTTWFYSCEGDI